MNEAKHPLAISRDPDAQMIAVLRSCGFDVRVQHGTAAEAPEVYGTIDNAVSLFKLAVAGADCIGYPESRPLQQPGAMVGQERVIWYDASAAPHEDQGSLPTSQGEALQIAILGSTKGPFGNFTTPLFTAPIPVAGVQGERERLRAEQAERVMPLIGPLLDAYEGAPKDELADVSEDLLSYLSQINQAMISDDWQPDSGRSGAQGDVVIRFPDPEAVFAMFCDREGFPSDGDMDDALRKAFYEGTQLGHPAPSILPDSGRDAARLVKLLQTCTETKIKFNRDNQPRQITMIFKDSVQTSKGYQAKLRKTLDEFQPVEVAAQFKDAKGGAE